MTEITAEEIYREVHAKYRVSGGIADKYDLEAMHEFANQRYTPAEVLAIMENVRDECIGEIDTNCHCVEGFCFTKETPQTSILSIDLDKFLTK